MTSELPFPNLLKESQVATYLNISIAWLQRQRWLGEGPPYLRINRSIRYDIAALAAWLDAHRIANASAEVTR